MLKDKVILITGSTKGIGNAIARECVASQAAVMLHGLEEELAAETAQLLGDSAGCFVGDVSDPSVCKQLVDATVARFGRIDGLVNNAAVMTRSDIDSSDADTFDATIAVNLRAPLLLTREAVQHFRRVGRGVVVNIGSTNALSGEPNQLVYSMAKGALMTMTRNLGNALARENIRVVQLNVGWTLTQSELERKKSEGLPDGWENHIDPTYAPTGRLLSPHEVAKHVVFWLSDCAGPANGVVYELEQYPLIGRQGLKN